MSPTSTSSPAISTGTSVFETGKHKTLLLSVETTGASSSLSALPPKPLLIATPSEAGEFPVLLLLHGYLFYNSFYSQLIQHIASHGFVVVAPQVRFFLGTIVGNSLSPKNIVARDFWRPLVKQQHRDWGQFTRTSTNSGDHNPLWDPLKAGANAPYGLASTELGAPDYLRGFKLETLGGSKTVSRGVNELSRA